MSPVVKFPTVSRGRLPCTCAVCGMGGCQPYFMTHGIVVALCKAHRELSYLRRHSGWVFVGALRRHFLVRSGSLSVHQLAALQVHVGRVIGTWLTSGPGSYAWPTVRVEAEARFAAGHDPRIVIAQLRRRYSASTAIVPSIRTLQRWFSQGRWLADPGVWHNVFRTARRRRNSRAISYVCGPTLAQVVFEPTKAWSRKLNPWYPSENNFTMRA